MADFSKIGIPRLMVKPSVEPVTLDDMKEQLNLGGSTAFDAFLLFATRVARKQLENRLDRSFMDQRWRIYFDSFPFGSGSGWPSGNDCAIRLRKGPVRTIREIGYIDTSGDDQILATDKYSLDPYRRAGRGEVFPTYSNYWPDTRCERNAVYIELDAGATDPDDVPEEILMGIRMITAEYFEARKVSALANLSKQTLADLDAITSPYSLAQKIGAF